MASTYSTNLALELIGTGDQAGTWGVTTNTNLGTLLEQAISGYVTQAVATGTDTTITIPNGATGVARNMCIEMTGTGGASTNLIVPANKKLYFIYNNTSSGQVTVKVAGQTGVSVPNGAKMILVSNGTDIVKAVLYTSGTSLLYGDGSGGFSNVTIGSGITFAGGTLSATGSGGTVTSVTATSPVASTGGTTPVISMPAATASVNGYLTSTDWTTFNNKGSGTVTSVTATSPVASTGGTTPVISMPAATTSVSGYLTSTDWTTFNNKAPATSGTSILYGNGSGGFSNVTIGSGVSFAGGTLSATGSGGTVTSVTATSPVASTGGTTPVISMPAATTSVSGYLTSTDWNTFNNKQPAGSYLTSVTADSPLTGSGTSASHLSIPAASGSTNGYLTSTDWTTFNNKGSGTVTSVTATSPVASTGGTTPVISMPAATASVNGYLTSTDWTTFNNKGSGTVTSVTATSPVASTGGTTPVISMPAATASVNGYLTSTDWTTFNNKGSGTVTSVTATSPVASTGGTTPVISMPAATASVSGYLTSTDWNTFNNKGSGTITGSGTTNYIPKFSSSTALGNSLISDNGTTVNIGTTTSHGLTVTGNITAYYSDDRLKTRKGNIENALDKVLSLDGFHYEANEVAQSFGYEVKPEVGLSAQQVQAVLPEVVVPAPIDNQYLTVHYERIIPLLVEAIKELNAKLDKKCECCK